MKQTLDKLEAIVVGELKKRTGIRSGWNLMGVAQRNDFLDTMRGKFAETLKAAGEGKPATSKPAGKEKATFGAATTSKKAKKE